MFVGYWCNKEVYNEKFAERLNLYEVRTNETQKVKIAYGRFIECEKCFSKNLKFENFHTRFFY